MIRRIVILLPVLFELLFSTALLRSALASDQKGTILSLLVQMERSYARIKDYEAIFHKQERVRGELLPEETILLKFKKPLSVYMKWIEDPFKGTEALYAEGKYDNKLLIHRGGVLRVITLSLDPRGSLAMKENRHPITEAGFGFLIEGLRQNVEAAIQNGDLEIQRIDEKPFLGRPAIIVEASFLPRNGRKYYATRLVCHVDKQLMLPTGVSFYDERDMLFERYSYTEVRINMGLTATDFDRNNKAYGF